MERYMRDTFFFARIMKEHGLVPEAGFVCADKAWREKADWFRQQFEELLRVAVSLGNGRVFSGRSWHESFLLSTILC